MLVCVGFTVLGCAMFAAAQSAGSLVVARALLGFGTASFLMAPCALYARWFPPERFSTFTGIHLGLGTLGALLATAPLAFATAAVGWRATFLGIGAGRGADRCGDLADRPGRSARRADRAAS